MTKGHTRALFSGLVWRVKPIANVLVPRGCIVCGKTTDTTVCADCRTTLHYIQEPYCTRCGKPFTTGSGVSHVCYDCIKGKNAFMLARAVFEYNGAAIRLIHRFKFGDQVNLAAFFSDELLMLYEVYFAGLGIDAILPVPLSPRRLKHRSYNQSHLISTGLSRSLSIPVLSSVLVKIKETQPQSRLRARQRQDNVKGAYEITDRQALRGKSVLLIDDVITTGATVNACTRSLLRAGAHQVYVMAIALRV